MGVQNTYSRNQSAAFAGMLADSGPHDIFPLVNSEASASIPFGVGVKKGTGDLDGLLPTSENDVIVGFTVHTHAYARGSSASNSDLDDNGDMRPGAVMNVLRRGRLYVYARKSAVVAYTSRLWVRAVAGAGEYLGAAEDADDSTDTIDCQGQGQFISSGAADSLVVLDVDFTNKP